MKPRILEVVHARHARAAWAKAIKLVSRELGFKPGRDQISGLPGWIRDTDERRETFFFQINPYGFDKYSGGSFVVEFTSEDKRLRTWRRDRLWELLDELSRRDAFNMNNRVIESQPAPSTEFVESLPGPHRPLYLTKFEPVAQVPPPGADFWFRYATQADVDWWGDFVASRLRWVLAESGTRLANQPPGTSGGILGNEP
jgi:hypothetical protein